MPSFPGNHPNELLRFRKWNEELIQRALRERIAWLTNKIASMKRSKQTEECYEQGKLPPWRGPILDELIATTLVLNEHNLLRDIAAMTLDGEEVDGKPHEMSIDDAFDTLHSLVQKARHILNGQSYP